MVIVYKWTNGEMWLKGVKFTYDFKENFYTIMYLEYLDLEYIKTLQMYFRNTKEHLIMLGGHVKKIKISGFNYILGYRQF